MFCERGIEKDGYTEGLYYIVLASWLSCFCFF
jgi:hypothetical protein